MKTKENNKKLNIRQQIGIVLLFIGIVSISSVKELVTGSVCKFGEGCIETAKSVLNVEKLGAGVILIILGFILWLYPKEKRDIETIKRWDPERLHMVNQDNASSKQIRNPKNTYYSQEIKQLGMKDKSGRKVKVWRLVKSAFDEMNDIYIPIYYKNRGK